jgi:sugar lactone lactonase YvrE
MTAKRIAPRSDDLGEEQSEIFDDEETYEPSEPARKPASSSRTSSRLRLLLAVNLGVLVLLLAGAAYALTVAATPKGAPKASVLSVIAPASTEMEWVRSIYSWGNGQAEHLVTPNTVAIGPDGVIWTNSKNRYAVAFNPDGSFDRILMSNPSTASAGTTSGSTPSKSKMPGVPDSKSATASPTGVNAVFSIAVDSKNNLFIGDDSDGAIMKFTPEGRLEQGWSVPGLLKVAANDSAVAVVGQGNLGVFTQSTGDPIYAFGSRGQGVDQFDLPMGVHIDNGGNVYVADTQNQRVRKYDATGRLLWDAGTVPDRTTAKSHGATSAVSASGIFELPTGLTVDGNGRVVVVDAFKYAIIVLDGATGQKVAEYGDFGPEDGFFDNPSAIAYDPARDYFVVADTQNNRLQVVRLPGSSKSPVVAAVVRAADRPIWVLGLPVAFLLVAVPGTTFFRRWRAKKAMVA